MSLCNFGRFIKSYVINLIIMNHMWLGFSGEFNYLINHLLFILCSDSLLGGKSFTIVQGIIIKYNCFFKFNDEWKKIDFFIFAFEIASIAWFENFLQIISSKIMLKSRQILFLKYFIFKDYCSNIRMKSNIGSTNISQNIFVSWLIL